MLLNGSGLALTPTRMPVLMACEASADPPPSAAAASAAFGEWCCYSAPSGKTIPGRSSRGH
jgi:hypothetical protein